jgi:hypothetical protein
MAREAKPRKKRVSSTGSGASASPVAAGGEGANIARAASTVPGAPNIVAGGTAAPLQTATTDVPAERPGWPFPFNLVQWRLHVIAQHKADFLATFIIAIIIMWFVMGFIYERQLSIKDSTITELQLIAGSSKDIIDAQNKKILQLQGEIGRLHDDKAVAKHMME